MGDQRNEDTIGAGSHSIAGYEYQIDVSVWLALDLVLASKLAQELILEPASQEDIEADLDEFEPGRLTSSVAIGGYHLIVQAKLRTGDAWTVAGINALLKHGKMRQSAAKRLENEKVRYLLVTSASLNGGTRGMRVVRSGNWPKAEEMPVTIRNSLPAGSPGRVAIIPNSDSERLATYIKTLLTESFRIPNKKLNECWLALREQARARMVGAGGGRWTRSQLEDLIRRNDGYIADSSELEHYVHPTNWNELRDIMNQRHAALIIGQSGTGKTLATRKLYEELRAEMPGLARVPITLGPEQLRDDTTAPPVLYDIEDPWGRYDFDPKSRPWNDQLSLFLSNSHPDRLIVATSRLDVAQSSGAINTVEPWLVRLEAENYGDNERRRLYRNRIDSLPRELHALARDSASSVLAELATPLEIQKFFDALSTIDDEMHRNPRLLVAEAIRRAHQDSIEQTVVDQIGERQDIRAAAVLWGLLKASDKISLQKLREIEEHLAEHGPYFEKGVLPLARFFIAARNLRQTDTVITYYHPRVEAGIERALNREALIARRTLRLLVEILALSNDTDDNWGVPASARVLFAIDRMSDLKPKPSPAAKVKIDTWMEIELAKGGAGFERILQMAASVGSAQSNAAETARFLLHRPDRTFGGFSTWGVPHRDDPWYERMRSDEGVRRVVDSYIRDVLPQGRVFIGAEFVAAAERLALDLTPAFLAAAKQSVHYGVIHSHDAIATGALNDIAGFEEVVDAAVAELTPSEEDRKKHAEIHLAIINDVYSEDYAEYLSDNEDGWTASEYLKAYVGRIRAVYGWRRLVKHRHAAYLRYNWYNELLIAESIDATELSGAFAAGHGSNDEHYLWYVLEKHWDPLYERSLLARIMDGHPQPRIRTAALTCCVNHLITKIPEIYGVLTQQKRSDRLIEIAIELGVLHTQRSGADGVRLAEAAKVAADLLPSEYLEVSKAAFALESEATPALSSRALELISSVTAFCDNVRVFRIALNNQGLISANDDIQWILTESESSRDATAAIDAAIRQGMNIEISAGLSHKFADVVIRSLQALAGAVEAPLPQFMLDLALHKGSGVRKALADILAAKPHPSHVPTLLELANDEWSPRSDYTEDYRDHPIARAAVVAISKTGPVSEEVASKLYRTALGTRDFHLRQEIFTQIVESGHLSYQRRIFELSANPGRREVRQTASHALLVSHPYVHKEIIKDVTAQLLQKKVECVASRLLLLLAIEGDTDDLLEAAKVLSTNLRRRALLLLAIWILSESKPKIAHLIADMLPPSHAASTWALSGAKREIDKALIDELGDPICVEQVTVFMQPKRKP